MAGFSDVEQRLCLGLSLWNGRDPILKERMFGLTGAQANHGEDVKEYWWYLDAVPSHAWNRWRYHYPQAAYPVRRSARRERTARQARRRVRVARHRRVRRGPLLDRGGRLRQGRSDRRDHGDPGHQRRARRRDAPRAADGVVPQHVVVGRRRAASRGSEPAPTARSSIGHPFLGELELLGGAGVDGSVPPALFCENETNTTRLFGTPPATPLPEGRDQRPRRRRRGHRQPASGKAPRRRSGTSSLVAGGETAEVRLRLRPAGSKPKPAEALGEDLDHVVALRRQEADEFYAELSPARHLRRTRRWSCAKAFAGMLWSKQLYAYDVERWLDGDPTQPPPPPSRRLGRNARWSNFDAFDIMSMPDKWEYPWFAAWDLGFHCVALAHVDPAFAKYQLLLLCREWFQHPNGALPAYEWDFGDVNPPVQAWAALEVFAIDGAGDLDFLSKVFDKLLGQLHVVGEPRGLERNQPVRGRVPRTGQHRPARPVAPPRRRNPRAVRRHRMDGVLRPRHGGHRLDPHTAPAIALRPIWCSSSSSTSQRSAGRWTRPACGTRTKGSTTTSSSHHSAPPCR